MKTDYITGGSTLPSSLTFPRFLLGMELRTTTKEIYAILLDMAMNGDSSVDSRGRRYLTFINPDIAAMIDRTTGTVSQSLAELEQAGLIKRRLMKRNAPYRTYVMLPAGEGRAVIVHMNYQQYRTARRLVHSCCNYDCGNCLLLDNGEECICPQSITYSLVCRWFRAAVLPLDAGLCAALLYRDRMKPCSICGGYFLPNSNRAKYCPECAAAARRKKEAERQRRTLLRFYAFRA